MFFLSYTQFSFLVKQKHNSRNYIEYVFICAVHRYDSYPFSLNSL